MSGVIERYGRLRVPADASGAKRYLRENLFIPHGWRERLQIATGRLAPDGLQAVDAVLESEPHLVALQKAADAIGMQKPISDWIAVDDYAGGRRIAIAVLFESTESAIPVAYVKVREKGDGASLARERDALNELATGRIAATVPSVRAWFEDDEREVLALSTLTGASMLRETKMSWRPSRHVATHFKLAGDWLEIFQKGHAGAMHGDFWARNVLIGNEGPAVVDWECFDATGDPLHDVFQFALTYALEFRWDLRDRVDAVERFRRGFATRHGVSRATRQWMTRFGRVHSLSPVELRQRMSHWLLRGVNGLVERPKLSREQWTAMIEIIEGRAQCVFSG